MRKDARSFLQGLKSKKFEIKKCAVTCMKNNLLDIINYVTSVKTDENIWVKPLIRRMLWHRIISQTTQKIHQTMLRTTRIIRTIRATARRIIHRIILLTAQITATTVINLE